jgi:hypothetical protein
MNQILQFPPQITLPGSAPVQETVQWQGRPNWRAAATRIWHIRVVAFYFAVLLADGVREAMGHTPAAALARQGEFALLLIALGAVAVLLVLSWLTGRTTTYTITDTHVMMKYGIALQATLVIPFGAIEYVGIRVNPDHTGDLALRLKRAQNILYPKLWPHVRPWTLLRAEPMLRCVPQAGAVGALLARGIGAQVEMRGLLERDLASGGRVPALAGATG